MPEFTQAEDDTLRDMWRAHSPREIAVKLGRTKNSILGRAHRLKLEKKKSPIARKDPKPLALLPRKGDGQCAEPACYCPVERGSYCKAHAALYYVPYETRPPARKSP